MYYVLIIVYPTQKSCVGLCKDVFFTQDGTYPKPFPPRLCANDICFLRQLLFICDAPYYQQLVTPMSIQMLQPASRASFKHKTQHFTPARDTNTANGSQTVQLCIQRSVIVATSIAHQNGYT